MVRSRYVLDHLARLASRRGCPQPAGEGIARNMALYAGGYLCTNLQPMEKSFVRLLKRAL